LGFYFGVRVSNEHKKCIIIAKKWMGEEDVLLFVISEEYKEMDCVDLESGINGENLATFYNLKRIQRSDALQIPKDQ
jgi:hypothetical protein